MSSQELFTVTVWKGIRNPTCEFVEIYGPTKQKLESGKPIMHVTTLGNHVLKERDQQLKNLDKNKKKYEDSNRMEEWAAEYKRIVQESNWKIRVLNEQEKQREKDLEDAELLLNFAKKAKQEEVRNIRKEKRANKQEEPLRRSKRIRNQNKVA